MTGLVPGMESSKNLTGHIPFDKRIPKKFRSGGTSEIAVSIQSEEDVAIAIEME